jgi:hypothetical protein
MKPFWYLLISHGIQHQSPGVTSTQAELHSLINNRLILPEVLHWLSSTMAAYTLQQIFSITVAVCSCDLVHTQDCLLAVLQDLKISQITWPSTKEKCRRYSDMIKMKYLLLTNCFGFIDGLNLPVHVADDEE